MVTDLLTKMMVFCRIVECKGIRSAAPTLRLSPTAISMQLAALEAHLGVRLLDRTTRRVSLTEDGAAYLSHCQRILAEVAETEALLARSKVSPKGRLTVDMPTTVGRMLVVPHLAAFCRRYPDVQMELTFSSGLEIAPRNRFDVHIHIGPLQDSSLIARPIGVLRSTFVASPGYLARHGEPQTPADLTHHRAVNFIDPLTRQVPPWALWHEGRQVLVPMPDGFVASEHEARLQAAEAGLGMAQMLTLDAEHSVRSGALQIVLREFEPRGLQLMLVYQRHRQLSAKVRSFVDFIVERYPGDGNLDPLTTEPWWLPGDHSLATCRPKAGRPH